MDFDYVVEVKDFLGFVIDHREFDDSNTAYHEYRLLSDQYRDNPNVTVILIEPEYD